MDTNHCPKCNSKAVVLGRFDVRGWSQRFEPIGMRIFRFWGQGVSCPEPFRACLACGLVWTHLQPEDLRAFIEKHGKDEAKLKLSPFRKGHPEQDLA